MMKTTLHTWRHHLVVVLVSMSLLLALGGCASSAQSTSNTAQPAAVAQAKINTKIAPADYQAKFGAGADHLLLDVRTPEEFNSGHIAGAVNISIDELAQRLNEVPQDKPVVLYCRSGNRSNQASQILERAGYAEIYDLGGIINWAQQGYPVE